MLPDYHVHTEFSGDSKTPIRAQAEAAIARGMTEMCITDHHDCGSEPVTGQKFILDIPSYLPAIRGIAGEYEGRLHIYTGIELGLMLRKKKELPELEKELPVDYIIGSNHFIDGFDVYDRKFYEGRTDLETYRRYFESSLARVKEMDCFDCLGHLDYVIRYGPEKDKNYRPADFMDVIDEILRTLIEKGKGLECNTAGFKHGLHHPHPREEILKRYLELGGEIITVGSDAHVPEFVGGSFEAAEEILKSCGFRYYTVFHERKPVFYKL